VTEEPAHSRRVRYRVADNFLSFWRSSVDPYRAEIERGLGSTILPALMGGIDDHMGPRWEEAFRAHLRRLAAAGELDPRVVAICARDKVQDPSPTTLVITATEVFT
jgi:uncharacterized protein